MAQAGYTPISTYFSSTAAATPSSGNLVAGELALNTTDEKLYFKNASGVVKLLASNAITTPVLTFQTSLSGLTPSTATTGAVTLAGTLGAISGGTSQTTYATGDILYASASNTLAKLTAGTNGFVLTLAAGIPSWAASTGGVTSFQTSLSGLTPSTLTTGAITLAGTLGATSGGTSQSTYAAGDILYASASNTLAKLAAGTNGHVLTLAAGLPTWAAGGGGSGDVVGPSSATDTAITLFDGTTGKLVKNSLVTVSATGAIVAPQVGSTIPFYFVNQAAFPSATTYHGALAHSHADGAMYFAHSTAWVRLLDASTAVTVAQGGTGLTAGTSGGIPYYSSTSAITSSALLTQYGVVYGGGAGAAPVATAAGTTGQVLTATTGGAPTWAAAAGGLTGFTAALNVAAPNATNNVSSLTASGGTTNQFVTVAPKGTGGLIGGIPDSASAGGDIRGTYAVDLMFLRTASTQVASGDRSVIIGGSQNTASASFSIVIGGQSNSNSGGNSAIIGGNTNTITQSNSVVLSGQYGSDRGTSSVVQPSSNTSVLGGNQARSIILVAATTNATATIADTLGLNSNTANRNVNLEDNTILNFTAYVTAGVTGAGNAKMFTIKGGIKRGAGVGTTVLVGTPAVNIDAADAGASTWTVAVTADTATGILKFTCTGQAATSIKWTIRCLSVEAGY